MIKTILITGASTGIGYGAAKAFIGKGYRVIAGVRKDADSERLRAELGSNIHPIICDVTVPEHVASLPNIAERLTDNGFLDGLINNAGIFIGINPVELQKEEDIRAQFETNVFGLMAVTQALLPLLGTSKKAKEHAGRIINISSVGGIIGGPFMAPYVATKHAVEGYSHVLRREMRLFGIKVIILGPGSIKSEIWNKNPAPANNPLASTPYETAFKKFMKVVETVKNSGASPDEIGEFIVRIFEKKRPRARYAFMNQRFLNWTLPALLPHLWLDELFGLMMGLHRQKY